MESFTNQVIRRLQRAAKADEAQQFAASAQEILHDCEKRIMDEAKKYLEVRE